MKSCFSEVYSSCFKQAVHSVAQWVILPTRSLAEEKLYHPVCQTIGYRPLRFFHGVGIPERLLAFDVVLQEVKAKMENAWLQNRVSPDRRRS